MRSTWNNASKIVFLRSTLSNSKEVIPEHFSIRDGHHRITNVGTEAGKAARIQGGSENIHSLCVVFEGLCFGKKKHSCESTYTAGFEENQLQLLASPSCESITAQITINKG